MEGGEGRPGAKDEVALEADPSGILTPTPTLTLTVTLALTVTPGITLAEG